MIQYFRIPALAIFLILPLQQVLAEGLSKGNPKALGFHPDRLERLDAVLQAYVDDGKLAGSTVLIARQGKVAYQKSFGWRDREARDRMENDDIFRIASQTKAITSVGIMILQEQGKLLISDPLAKYLPEFAKTFVAEPQESGGYDIVPAKSPITLRHLLMHTSGIDYGFGPAADDWKKAGITGWYFADRTEPVRETIRRMAPLANAAQPGERWVYGYNTDILGAVIEVVSGKPLDVFFQENILKPLGMKDTHFYLPKGKKDRLAVVYSLGDDGLVRAPEPGDGIGQGHYVKGPRKSFSGGAGLLSTADDYARFLQMLLNGGTLDGVRILSRHSVNLMTADHLNGIPFNPGVGFGLGFTVVTDVGAKGEPGAVGRYGWGGAYHSSYWVDPLEGLVVTYFTQVIPAGGLDDHQKLNTLIYQALE